MDTYLKIIERQILNAIKVFLSNAQRASVNSGNYRHNPTSRYTFNNSKNGGCTSRAHCYRTVKNSDSISISCDIKKRDTYTHNTFYQLAFTV